MEKSKKRIYLSSPHMCGLEEKYIREAFETNWIAPLGPNVDGFEQELSTLVGAKHALAVSSGTAGIHMALKYLDVSSGDTVFCSALTFAASCNPIIYQGGVPVFIDSEPETLNMSPTALKKAFETSVNHGKLPKAVIVVDLYGQSADMDAIKRICDSYGVPIVEDSAEALGATYKGRYSGTGCKFGIYSFNGNKIITTSGGGMIVSDDEAAIKKIKFWITQAKDEARYYQHSEIGYNFRLSNVLAGIGRGQLRVLQDRIRTKKEIFETYKNGLANIPFIEFMPISENGNPNYWLTIITIKAESQIKPLDILVALEKENIEARPVWKPMQLQPVFDGYEFFSHKENTLSVSEDIFNRGLCLPSDTKMTAEDQERVIEIIRNLFI